MQRRSTTALALTKAREQARNEVFVTIFLPYSCGRFCIRSLSDPSPTNSYPMALTTALANELVVAFPPRSGVVAPELIAFLTPRSSSAAVSRHALFRDRW